MNSHDLIETVRRPTEAGAPQPTQTDLRRAVSTAYYALFHCLVGTAADLLTGSNSDHPEWHQVYRALEHGKARSACQQQDVMGTFPLEVRAFGDTFIDLQKARQNADYAHEGEYSTPEVLAIINAAEDAISKFEQADVRYRRSFVVHALFKRWQP